MQMPKWLDPIIMIFLGVAYYSMLFASICAAIFMVYKGGEFILAKAPALADWRLITIYGSFIGASISVSGALFIANLNYRRQRKREIRMLRDALATILSICRTDRKSVETKDGELSFNAMRHEFFAEDIGRALRLPAIIEKHELDRVIDNLFVIDELNEIQEMLSKDGSCGRILKKLAGAQNAIEYVAAAEAARTPLDELESIADRLREYVHRLR
ncbi:hypothetical protein [Sphingomonas sanxanigenens]|uniref:Uncharacterized protein n=1 Tax=Sphingomonas sanxanigenens DSM 19645 = NX02 TaxID=1123269 RepID=W0ABR3_9SPHN|nr:hypothetical protein [Sphingomonas sanxanigenens]AHE53105.1 hypothetical protein NX02_06890 [Sphingomonas sanxanigenens DSM 19645 = NX02]